MNDQSRKKKRIECTCCVSIMSIVDKFHRIEGSKPIGWSFACLSRLTFPINKGRLFNCHWCFLNWFSLLFLDQFGMYFNVKHWMKYFFRFILVFLKHNLNKIFINMHVCLAFLSRHRASYSSLNSLRIKKKTTFVYINFLGFCIDFAFKNDEWFLVNWILQAQKRTVLWMTQFSMSATPLNKKKTHTV